MESTQAPSDQIARYLAGRLTDEERRAFESACAADPALLDELHQSWQLKAGLEELDARGELPALVHGRPAFWGTPAFAMAASVVAFVCLGIAAYSLVRSRNQELVVQRLQDEVTGLRAPRVLSNVQGVLLLRGATEIELPMSGWLGLSVDADGFENSDIVVELSRGDGKVIWRHDHHVSDDGSFLMALDPATVPPGEYALTLRAGTGALSKRYELRTRRGGTS